MNRRTSETHWSDSVGPALAGYALETVRSGPEFTLYRGKRKDSAVSVLILLPATGGPTSTQQMIENEYALTARLDSTWAVRPLALERFAGQIALILEDTASIPLSDIVGQPFELGEFLAIAASASRAVGQMHHEGLIHKRIEPGNMMVDPEGTVRLSNFGAASGMVRERQPVVLPEMLVNSLAYMAPEQTGRMNRSIDARSDLYSLGIVFYEMLTGGPPFHAVDPLGWVHCHVTRQPEPLCDRVVCIPETISEIVHKLLAKNAEDRYQTADSLTWDLQICLDSWRNNQSITEFPIGRADRLGRVDIPEKLYGRETETGVLMAAADRVTGGALTEAVLVRGQAGAGKTALVSEFQRTLVLSRTCFFAGGKGDQFRRDAPYGTLAQVIHDLIRQLLILNASALASWQEALQRALGQNGRLMTDLVPELSFVIGEQPPLTEIAGPDAKARFALAFHGFLDVFAQANHPLVIFIDDMQWLDRETLDLLAYFLTAGKMQHFLVVGAYRDDEPDSKHPLRDAIEEADESQAMISEILIAPLDLGDVESLIMDSLRCDRKRAKSLGCLVHQKTGGNPFFVNQFLDELVAEGHIRYDPREMEWKWILSHIQAKTYTDNVVDLLIGKLRRLSQASLEAVMQLACLGRSAEVDILSIIRGNTEEDVQKVLLEAESSGLIFRINSKYIFLHDRVREAAYTLFSETDRVTTHLQVARALAFTVQSFDLQDRVFEVVDHFDHAAALLTTTKERLQVAEWNLIAARRAKQSSAYDAALGYATSGLAMLGHDGWKDHHEIKFELAMLKAECERLRGNSDIAMDILTDVTCRAKTKVEQASVCRAIVELHVMRSDNVLAVNEALRCLRHFGIDMSPHPPKQELEVALAAVSCKLQGRTIESLIELPRARDPEVESAMRILEVLHTPAYFTDENLVYLHLCHMVLLTLAHGVSESTPHGMAWFGVALGYGFGRHLDGQRFGQLARELVERHSLTASRAKVLISLELVTVWVSPLSKAFETVNAAFIAAIETGDVAVACYCCCRKITNLRVRGDHLEVAAKEVERDLEFARRVKFPAVVDLLTAQQNYINLMRGASDLIVPVASDHFNGESPGALVAPGNMVFFWYWILKGQEYYLLGNFPEAANAFEKARPLEWTSAGHIQLLEYHIFSALTLGALNAGVASNLANTTALRQLRLHEQQLRIWARNNRATFADKEALISAEIARIEGRELDAMRLYELAVSLSRENGFIQYEALAHETAARFYRERGVETVARTYLKNAHTCYASWGAIGKIHQLEICDPELWPPPVVPTITGSDKIWLNNIDLNAVIGMSQAFSSEILLDRLIEQLMATVLACAGASRGLLLLPLKGDICIAAEALTDRDTVNVDQRWRPALFDKLPGKILNYVKNTLGTVILDDALKPNPYREDRYFNEARPRSVLCLPLAKQKCLVGILYLENNLSPDIFTADRLASLWLLASQAAVAIENANLFLELQKKQEEAQRADMELRRAFDLIPELAWCFSSEGEFEFANRRWHDYTGMSHEAASSGHWISTFHSDDIERVGNKWTEVLKSKSPGDIEARILTAEGASRKFLVRATPIRDETGKVSRWYGTNTDIDELKRTEEAQEALARTGRIIAMGELTVSIAHEVNQPLMAIVTNAATCLQWLKDEKLNIEEARKAAERVIRDGHRAADVIKTIRTLARKSPTKMWKFDLNEMILEILVLVRDELQRGGVTQETQLEIGLELAVGDRVQLQQVILNLLMNALDAMNMIEDRARLLTVSTRREKQGHILVTVADTGVGVEPAAKNRLFEAFFTTKPEGIGMGLSICRSIIETHGGSLWTAPRHPHGTAFHFTIPTYAQAEGETYVEG